MQTVVIDEEMEEKNSVVYVAMIAGYGKCSNVEAARRVFVEIRGGICRVGRRWWRAILRMGAQRKLITCPQCTRKMMREKGIRKFPGRSKILSY